MEPVHLVFQTLVLRLKKVQTIGIIGGTGSGKSTLISLIPRFYDAVKGNVLIDGQNVKNYTHKELCEKIAVVQQKAVLFKGSIRENLKWGNELASDSEIYDAIETAQAKEVVEKKEGQLDFQLEQMGRNLSGGQKQRAAVARALITNPKLILADEPTGALDSKAASALLSVFGEINAEGQTILMVTHSAQAASHASRVLFIKDGEVFHQIYKGSKYVSGNVSDDRGYAYDTYDRW